MKLRIGVSLPVRELKYDVGAIRVVELARGEAVSRQELDVTELSVSSYLLQVSRGDCGYVGIPAFVSRGFRHGAVYVRADRGIDTPKDLEG